VFAGNAVITPTKAAIAIAHIGASYVAINKTITTVIGILNANDSIDSHLILTTKKLNNNPYIKYPADIPI